MLRLGIHIPRSMEIYWTFQSHTQKFYGHGLDGWEYIFVSINVIKQFFQLLSFHHRLVNRKGQLFECYIVFQSKHLHNFIKRVDDQRKNSFWNNSASYFLYIFSRQRKRTIIRGIGSRSYHINSSKSSWTKRIWAPQQHRHTILEIRADWGLLLPPCITTTWFGQVQRLRLRPQFVSDISTILLYENVCLG